MSEEAQKTLGEPLEDLEVAPWDPNKHDLGVAKVSVHDGRTLSYGKRSTWDRWKLWLILPMIVLGYLTGMAAPSEQWLVLVAGLGFYGMLGVVIWQRGELLLYPVRWSWDWEQRTLTHEASEEKAVYQLDDVRGVVFTLSKEERVHEQGTKSENRYHVFEGTIRVRFAEDEEGLLVGSTNTWREEPDAAYRSGFAFASMLAEKLDVPLTYTRREFSLEPGDRTQV